MDGRTLIDEFFALANGSLAPEEERRLRERCAADPRLRAALEEYLEVHALTEPGAAAVPPCRLEFAEVESALATRVRRGVLRRFVRIAAAVLVLVVGGLYLSRVTTEGTGPGDAGAVALRAIPLSTEEVAPPSGEAAETLANYSPVEDGKIRWISSYEAARTAARLGSRPVFLYIYHPTCPYCLKMDRSTFTDPEVVRRMAEFVPAHVDVRSLPRELVPFVRKGWPYLGVVGADGGALLDFPGLKGPGELATDLDEALRRAGGPALDWERVRALAARLDAAVAAERAGRLAEAFVEYSALAGDEAAGPFRDDARAGRARIGAGALRSLLMARDIAATPSGVDAALTTLDAEIERLEGTPLADDLRLVRARLAADGRFPEIEGLAPRDGD